MFAKLPLTALRAFESAARLGGFKAASEELFVTPAAVSHQIKTLEGFLGDLLFDRTTQGVKLTASGERLYSNVHLSFLDMSRSIASLKPPSDSQALRVSTTPAFAALWLIPRLGDFYNKHPEIHVSVEASNEVVDLLRDSTMDMAIRCGFKDYPELFSKSLMVEEFGVFTQTHWKLEDVGSSLKLIDIRWGTPSPASIDWALWCSAAKHEDWLAKAIYRKYNDEHFALQAAISGHGLALASTVLVADYVENGLLIPYRPEIKIPGARYSAVCVPGRERLSPVKDFLDWIVAATGDFRQGG
ncbi:LysR substrate-binding domain-containing protein [Pseudomonas halotolerans]|uniref:LysR substrate-binding domain-containing protein n=1 Tax=Pseudomonas halotolerans TaxID=3143552 RepID=UPI0031D73BC0